MIKFMLIGIVVIWVSAFIGPFIIKAVRNVQKKKGDSDGK